MATTTIKARKERGRLGIGFKITSNRDGVCECEYVVGGVVLVVARVNWEHTMCECDCVVNRKQVSIRHQRLRHQRHRCWQSYPHPHLGRHHRH